MYFHYTDKETDYLKSRCKRMAEVIESLGHINRNAWHVRKDGKPVTSAQVYACICRYPSIFTKEAGRICVML